MKVPNKSQALFAVARPFLAGKTTTSLLFIFVGLVASFFPYNLYAQVSAVNDAAATTVGKAVEIDVLSNDKLSTCNAASIVLTVATNPTKGSVVKTLDNKLIYTPNAGYVGRDWFDYSITCAGSTATARVSMLVAKFPSNFFESDCTYKPQSFSFSMGLKYESKLSVDNYNAMVTGDLDGDGYSEIVAAMPNNGSHHAAGSYLSNGFRIFNYKAEEVKSVVFPKDGTTSFIYSTNSNSITLGDLDNDGFGEILFSTVGRAGATNYQLMVYDRNGTLKATSPVSATPFVNTTGIADFDNDGYPEIYSGTSIYRYTGSSLIELYKGTANVFSVAQDVDGDGIPEIITPYAVYKVSLKTSTGTGSGAAANTVTLWKETGYTELKDKNYVFAVADVDLDGKLEVVTIYPTTTALTLLIWDAATGTAKYSAGVTISGGSLNCSFPFIGDSDGDGYPDIAFMGGSATNTAIHRFGYNKLLNKVEKKGVAGTGFQDFSSRVTGLSMFDFNLDGKMEIVYRDELNLYILDGTDFSKLLTIPKNMSGTLREYPLIASLTPSGEAYILINSSSIKSDQVGTLRIYASTSTPWAPARKMWNQFSFYQNTMNDNLKVIDYPLPLGYKMTSGSKTLYPFNGHMMQRGPIEESTLEFVHPAPDLTVTSVNYSLNTVTDVLTIKVTFTNIGNASMDAPITFDVYKTVGGVRSLVKSENFMEDLLVGSVKTFTITIPAYTALGTVEKIDVEVGKAKVDCTPGNNGGEMVAALKAVNDMVVTDVNTPITIPVVDNDETNGCSVVVSVVNPVKGGATISGNQIVYTPKSNDIGSDSFTYTITCNGDSSTAKVDITTASTVLAEWVKNSEEPSNHGIVRFKFREPGATCGANVKVHFTVKGDGLSEGVDYTLTPTSPATIPAGQSEVLVKLMPTNNFVVEGVRNLKLTITRVDVVAP